MGNPIDYAALVKAIRKSRGMTQEQLARELEVTLGSISGWENARHKPIASFKKKLVTMAESAGLKPGDFVIIAGVK